MDDLFDHYDLSAILQTLRAADEKYVRAIQADLDENGFSVVRGVLSQAEVAEIYAEFHHWRESTPQLQALHPIISPHGIYKLGGVGQTRHAWLTRTNPALLSLMKQLYKCDELVASFDGMCYIPPTERKRDNVWTHTDQSPFMKGEQGLQSFVSLTANKTRTFVAYAGSHLLHEPYFAARVDGDPKWKKNFLFIEPEFLESIKHTRVEIETQPGDLVLWDSRTFHQNQYGPDAEERVVQYVAYMPKDDPRNTPAMKRKRQEYFEDGRTTTHRAYPISVNGKQPQTYGDNSRLIDYSALPAPDLADLMPAIRKLI